MDELILVPEVILQYFDKWEIYFVGPINPPGKHTISKYVIIDID